MNEIRTYWRGWAAIGGLLLGLVLTHTSGMAQGDAGIPLPGGGRLYPPHILDREDEDCPTDEEITSQPVDPDTPAATDPTACPREDECPPGAGDTGCTGYGMPTWRVSEPYINLWVRDVPLFYTMSNGRVMPLVVRYKQRNSEGNTNLFGFGNGWECSWLSYFEPGEGDEYGFRVPGGGVRRYSFWNGVSALGVHAEMATKVGNDAGGTLIDVAYRSTCRNLYRLAMQPESGGSLTLLTAKTDPHGRRLQFNYTITGSLARLVSVADYDGRTNYLYYTNRHFPRWVTDVRDPFGRQAHFQYDALGNLVQIIDVQGITNQFRYDTNGLLTAMVTPYGTTRFRSFDTDPGDAELPIVRSIEVTQPDGSREVYAYHEYLDGACVPTVEAEAPQQDLEVPEPVANDWMNQVNSFRWDSRQLASVTNRWPSFRPEHYRLARSRRWNIDLTRGAPALGRNLLLERQPSPDGLLWGYRVWYTYHYDPWYGIPTIYVSQRAERLPDGEVRYVQWQRNEWSRPTSIVATHEGDEGVAVRCFDLGYDETGRNLTELYGPDPANPGWPILQRAYAYNQFNQVTNVLNALGEQIALRYHPTNRNLVSIRFPSGLLVTNELDPAGFVTRRIWQNAQGTALAQHRFTWAGGKIQTSTDARGLTVRHFWDSLGRPTGRLFPDGTTLSNVFTRVDGTPYPDSTGGFQLLDRTRTKDRLNNWTTVRLDARRRPVETTDPLQRVTRFTWCDCGGPESVTDPLGQTTRYQYDQAGRVVHVQRPGGRVEWIAWDLLGRPTNVWSANGSLQIRFNHQGLWKSLAQSDGGWVESEYDALDRPVLVRSATGSEYEMAYDALDRLVSQRERVTGAVDSYRYASGVEPPVAYTNRLGGTAVFWTYDALERVTAEVIAAISADQTTPLTTNRFMWSSPGDLVTMLNGLNRRTSWGYDLYGRALRKGNALGKLVWTNSYNAEGWLTSHWTAARSNLTTYGYDAVGNVLRVDHNDPATADLQFSYDANNRPVRMVDAVGVTTLQWTPAGVLAAEDGPWDEDTLTFAFDANDRLQALALAQPGDDPWTQQFAYAGSGGLQGLASPAGQFDYAFKPGTRQVTAVRLSTGAFLTNCLDSVGRLLRTSFAAANGAVLSTHAYAYDQVGRRTSQWFPEGNRIDYEYDALGQLTAATGREADGQTRLHERFTYRYDAAGNLKYRADGLGSMAFAIDALNQLTSVTRSGSVPVSGMTSPGVTAVTVNGLPAERYADGSFAHPGLSASAGSLTVRAWAQDAMGRTNTHSIQVRVPSSVQPGADACGNLVNDGGRRFAYDGRGQLASVTVTNGVNDSTLTEFVYDAVGRRRIRREKTWQTSGWVQTAEVRYIWLGMLPLQERDAANLPVATYTRGLDVSGTLQGAGGIGGLLALTRFSGPSSRHYYYHADGAGNVTALVDTNSTPVAQYRYDPFGNLLGVAGSLAEANLLRFSSKEAHPTTGLIYFGFRFYDPALQRWISPDPIEESGGINLFRFVENSPVSFVDTDGRQPIRPPLRPAPRVGPPTARRPIALLPGPTNPMQEEILRNIENGGSVGDLSPKTRAWLLDDFLTRPRLPANTSISAPRSDLKRMLCLQKPSAPPVVRWGPENGLGSLSAETTASFRSSTYQEVVFTEPTLLFRSCGGGVGPMGRWWTRVRPHGPLQARIDAAIHPEWGNAANEVVAIRVPAGVTVYEGHAAPQQWLHGGGNQIYIKWVDPNWFISDF